MMHDILLLLECEYCVRQQQYDDAGSPTLWEDMCRRIVAHQVVGCVKCTWFRKRTFRAVVGVRVKKKVRNKKQRWEKIECSR